MALPFFDTTMIHLIPDHTAQTFSVSPYQQRKYMPTPAYSQAVFSNYLVVFKELATGEEFAVKPLVLTDNERETKMTIVTSVDSPLNAAVLIKNSGLYTYTIWAMSDDDSLNPTPATARGILETGTARFAAEAAWTTPDISIPSNVVYYE